MNKHMPTKTQLRGALSVAAESLERRIERMMTNKTPIGDAVPPIFTERKDGVLPETNIRTDKWEMSALGGQAIANGVDLERQRKAENKLKIVKDGDAQAGDASTEGGESISATK